VIQISNTEFLSLGGGDAPDCPRINCGLRIGNTLKRVDHRENRQKFIKAAEDPIFRSRANSFRGGEDVQPN
jgi:hypothetical protein